MIVIEMRLAAQEKAFDLIDEIKDLGRRKKMALCELEDTLYDCFESSKDDEEDSELIEDEQPVEFRKRGGYRSGRRSMLRNMREEDEMDDDMDTTNMRQYRRSMRMRRNRMGRFV